MITLTFCLFGALRQFDAGAPLILKLTEGANIAEVQHALCTELATRHPNFNQQALVAESAIANETEILRGDYHFTHDAQLAILPPVCGG